jgi:glycosyltransferase involved in cell wall biosynthesis
VAPIIDCYCICDTGSTDNTVDIIRTFFENKGIPGKIEMEPFRDFGYNRSHALKLCDIYTETCHIDYVLLLDADMYLTPIADVAAFKFSLMTRGADVYYLFQGSERFFYKNVRLVRPQKGYSYWGVTHEYVKTPDGTKYEAIDKSELFICDIGDGGAKADKFERDIRLLERGLEEVPNNDRYTFYLANSYRDAGHIEKAIETFKKRIKIGGWIEEVWHSYYSIGKCYMKIKDPANAIFWWMEGFNYYPKRIENLYEIVQYYRVEGKQALSYVWYTIADKQRAKFPITSDYLFLQKDVYDYKLDFELSIIGYYVNTENFDLCRCSTKVLADPNVDENTMRNVFSNYKFYSHKLVDSKSHIYDNTLIKVLETVGELSHIENEYVASTPSLCTIGDDIAVIRRYVNYRIDDQGNYVNQSHIKTKNIVGILKKEPTTGAWCVVNEFVMPYNKALDNIYIGLEDVRIMSYKNRLLYHANRGLDRSKIAVESGEVFLASEMGASSLLQRVGSLPVKDVEKNWVLVPSVGGEEPRVIYGWSPLCVGKVSNQTEFYVISEDDSVPVFFRHLRGSTNGVLIGNEIWFIGHLVSYEDRRYYYHMFMVLDSLTLKLKKYSTPFTFEGAKVEYTLGFVFTEDHFLIGYSIMDRETKYMTVTKESIDDMMICVI